MSKQRLQYENVQVRKPKTDWIKNGVQVPDIEQQDRHGGKAL